MKCLHICNDFLGSRVHENLYRNLHNLGVEQTIFYPPRPSTMAQHQNYRKSFDCQIVPSKPMKNYHRVLFRRKISYIYKSISSHCKEQTYDMVHATTLFSDGAVALRLKKEFGIPYVVAVRATDIGGYLKLRPDLLFLGEKILEESAQIVFISQVLKEKFLNHRLIRKSRAKIEHKCLVISNGIDSFWLSNITGQKRIRPQKILYVGTLESRKNSIMLIESVLRLNRMGVNCELTLVGEGGSFQKKVEELAVSNTSCIQYLGAIRDKETLRKIYDEHHIFALPSKNETFGLVYLEALSQGLPVLYVENEGIDGLFEYNIGEKCTTLDSPTIASNLEKLMINYPDYELEKIDFTKFSWANISKTYFELYQRVIKPSA